MALLRRLIPTSSWSSGSAQIRGTMESALGRRNGGDWIGAFGIHGRGYSTEASTPTSPPVPFIRGTGEVTSVDRNQFDAVMSLIHLERAIYTDKVSMVNLKRAIESGWASAVIRSITDREREAREAYGKLAAAHSKWGAAEKECGELHNEARLKAEEARKREQDLEDKYNSLVRLNQKHIRFRLEAIADLQRLIGQPIKRTILEATARESFQKHLAGAHKHKECVDYLAKLEQDGMISKATHLITGDKCHLLINSDFPNWSVIAHLPKCEGGAFLRDTYVTNEGVPILKKPRADLQEYIESNAQDLWKGSYTPHPLLPPHRQRFILYRGDQSDEETLLLISCFDYLDLPYEVQSEWKDPFVAAWELYHSARQELDEHYARIKRPFPEGAQV